MAVLSTSANIATPGLPVGSIQAFAGANAPTGWLLCDGSAVSRGNYPDLYNTIGNTYGSGDGSTTFNLPDLRGRMPIGAGNDGTAANNASRTRGDKGGDTRMQSHNHGGTTGNDSPDHAHGPGAGLAFLTTSGGAASNFGSQIAAAQHTPGQTAGANARHAHSISTSGSGGAENMPPFLVTNYIIKAVADIARGGWYTQSSPPVVTQLPTNPAIGEEVYLQSISSSAQILKRYNGTQWVSVSMPTGTVIQTVHGFTSTQVSLATSTYSSIGLSASITPRFSDSKILLLSSVQYRRFNWDNGFGLSLSRNGSTIYTPGSRYYKYQYEVSGGNDGGAVPFYYEDSPSSTSSLTYAILAATYNGTVDFQDDNHYRSTIILMEVAA